MWVGLAVFVALQIYFVQEIAGSAGVVSPGFSLIFRDRRVGDLSGGSGRPVEYRLGRGASPPRDATGAPWVDFSRRPQ